MWKSQVQKLPMGEIIILPNSILIERGHLQHAGAQWCCKNIAHCHILLILYDIQFKKAMAFEDGIILSTAELGDRESAEDNSSAVAWDPEGSRKEQSHHLPTTVLLLEDLRNIPVWILFSLFIV